MHSCVFHSELSCVLHLYKPSCRRVWSHPTPRVLDNDRPSRRCVSCLEVIASQVIALPVS